MKPSHLRGRKVCERILRQGNVWKSATMVIRWLPGSPRNLEKPRDGVFIGTFASTKLDKSAVRRNRMRRRCREALRIALLERSNLPSMQLLVAPRSSSLSCDFDVIRKDAEAFLTLQNR